MKLNSIKYRVLEIEFYKELGYIIVYIYTKDNYSRRYRRGPYTTKRRAIIEIKKWIDTFWVI